MKFAKMVHSRPYMAAYLFAIGLSELVVTLVDKLART